MTVTKRKILALVLAALVLAAVPATGFMPPSPARAAAAQSGVCGPGLTWEIDTLGNLTITGTGAMPDFTLSNLASGRAPWLDAVYTTSVKTVTLSGGVTSIGAYAFDGCTALTSAAIPNGVTSIGAYAFDGCVSLAEITIPGGVKTIGNAAFSRCKSLTAINLPQSVIFVGNAAFLQCESLVTATLSGKMTIIPGSMFYGCAALSVVTVPRGVKAVGPSAFYGCAALGEINLPESVVLIDYHAFSGCAALYRLTLPGGLLKIGEEAFADCSALTDVTIPKSVVNFGENLFIQRDMYTPSPPLPGVVIHGVFGGHAQRYALENGHPFIWSGEPSMSLYAPEKTNTPDITVWGFAPGVSAVSVYINSGSGPGLVSAGVAVTDGMYACDITLPSGGNYGVTVSAGAQSVTRAVVYESGVIFLEEFGGYCGFGVDFLDRPAQFVRYSAFRSCSLSLTLNIPPDTEVLAVNVVSEQGGAEKRAALTARDENPNSWDGYTEPYFSGDDNYIPGERLAVECVWKGPDGITRTSVIGYGYWQIVLDLPIALPARALVVPSDTPGAAINLTAQTVALPGGFVAAAYSVNGGAKWKKGELPSGEKLAKLINRGMTLWLASSYDSSAKKAAGVIIRFPKINRQQKANPEKLKPYYLSETWELRAKSGQGPQGNYDYSADGQWFAFTDGEFAVLSGNTKRTIFFRTCAVTETDGSYTPPGKAFRIKPANFGKAPNYKPKNGTVKLKNGSIYQAGSAEPERITAPIVLALGELTGKLTVWKGETGKKPRSEKQEILI
ncbi:MAG: leucine-rich repeat domain-containing protein [Oscillospiraceae bacterium]|jgi:hypothetical protein|nr:leucine-rich repeat domain-containing protein [Oscillospiraceae bacterium]